MRDIAFILFVLAGLVATLRAPYVGLMLWVLFSIMNPHQMTWSVSLVQWNLIIVIVTAGAWLLSSERKLPPGGITTVLVFLLLVWVTINTFFSFDPSFSWVIWNRTWKIIIMAVIASTLTMSMVRFHALMWVITLSLAYYGVKGGIFTVLSGSGGGQHILGPPNSMIGDNNTLAGALVMLLPIMNYLRVHSASRAMRITINVTIIIIVISILGSYSRGGYIGLAVVSLAFWLRAKNKIIYPILAIIVLLPILHFMPESFYRRAASIQEYSTDGSLQSRFDSWWVAYRYAMDHFPFGAGFYGIALRGVWAQYMGGMPFVPFAAHSIYFQVLGEQGVMGLVLYLLIIASTFLNLQKVRRNTKDTPYFTWAYDLAGMIQLSLLAFCVCGAALPLDFFDLFFLWAMLSAGLREMTRKDQAALAAGSPFVPKLNPVPRPLGIPPT